MLKKRVIFTLLYDNGNFMLSRNFRLQKVGDLAWLQRNYNFSKVAFSIDELIVLDVTRGMRDIHRFSEALKILTQGCFAPIAAGGGVRSVDQAKMLLRSGADKVVINTPLFEDGELINKLAAEFGQQCIVASVDVNRTEVNSYEIRTRNGTSALDGSLRDWLLQLDEKIVGEIYLNSMDRDGTGQGYDMAMLDHLPKKFSKPLILAGGAGNFHHLAEGLSDPRVDAVATAHLFNFVGDGLQNARTKLLESKIELRV
jgi:cyclase